VKRLILLADDSPTIQRLVTQMFAGGEFDVVAVSNGDAAVRKFEEIRPDIVLADIYMPGKNGYEVCAAVKKHPELADTPVVLLAGAFDAYDEETATQVGAATHITKPFEPQALLSLVGSLAPKEGRSRPAPAPASAAPPAVVRPTPPSAIAVAAAASVEFASAPLTLEVTAPPASLSLEGTPAATLSLESSAAPTAPLSLESDLEPAVPLTLESSAAQSTPLSLESTAAQAAPLSLESTLEPAAIVREEEKPTPVEEPAFIPVEGEKPLQLESALTSSPVPAPAIEAPPIEPPPAPVKSAAVETPAPPKPAAVDSPAPPADSDLLGLQELFKPSPSSATVSDAEIERIAQLVIQKLSTQVIENVAWDVVPDITTKVLKEELKRKS